jgi:hypothetical protein
VFFVPLAGLFFDFHTVLALTSILHVFSNAAKLVLFGRHVRWRLLLLLGIPSVVRGQRPRLQNYANQCRAAPVPLGFQHEKAGFAAAGGNVNNRRAR